MDAPLKIEAFGSWEGSRERVCVRRGRGKKNRGQLLSTAVSAQAARAASASTLRDVGASTRW
eukprot:7372602-Pyramimonas_sp.AAC.1